ncbi:MAG: hypothetical protein GXY22_01040 [Clostridiaceae bacterium]|nr:hypothetical protein [Clostridiaceae bacterium]
MLTLESAIVVPLTILIICVALMIIPTVYDRCRITARLEVLNTCINRQDDLLYRIDQLTVAGQSAPILQTSAEKMLLYSYLFRDLVIGASGWFR